MDKCYSSSGDEFHNSMEDVIDIYELNVGDTYYEGDIVRIAPSSLVKKWMAESILEWMEEQLFDEIGESAEDAISMDKEKRDELQKVICDFMDSNCRMEKYKVINIVERVYSGE